MVERRAHTAYAPQTGSMVQWLAWLRHLACRPGPGVSSTVGTRHWAARARGCRQVEVRRQKVTLLPNSQTYSTDDRKWKFLC